MAFQDCRCLMKEGEMIPWQEARFHVSCHRLPYGTGVSEGIRYYAMPEGAAVFRLDDHFRRLRDSALAHRVTGQPARYRRWPFCVNVRSDAAQVGVR